MNKSTNPIKYSGNCNNHSNNYIPAQHAQFVRTRKAYIPTPEEIKVETARIRASWSEETRQLRLASAYRYKPICLNEGVCIFIFSAEEV